MKIFLLIILLFFITGCDLIKPLPGNDSFTFGKEGIGIDKIIDKLIEKAEQIKSDISNFQQTGEFAIEQEAKSDFNVAESADLIAVSDRDGYGKATRIYQNGQFALDIVSELPAPKENYFYECWLMIPEPINYISIGRMIQETDGKYHLKFIVNNDYTNYNNIVVTLEADDNNSAPSATILQGEFVAKP